jgi:hypothetical protein
MNKTSDEKAKVLLTMDADLKRQLAEIAEMEERSLNGQITYILKRYVQEYSSKD